MEIKIDTSSTSIFVNDSIENNMCDLNRKLIELPDDKDLVLQVIDGYRDLYSKIKEVLQKYGELLRRDFVDIKAMLEEYKQVDQEEADKML